jgi:predicted RNA binding protein YcfA (HicA-like mRNA interferase family)
MGKLPAFKPKELIRKLEKLGFVLQRTTGSHMIYKNPETGLRANVPFHLREIPKGTLLSILRESQISKDEIIK